MLLAMGRALDEGVCRFSKRWTKPSMGLTPSSWSRSSTSSRSCTPRGTTVLVEQNAQMALSIADRAYVLGTGRITMSGPAAEVLADDRVRSAYLGPN